MCPKCNRPLLNRAGLAAGWDASFEAQDELSARLQHLRINAMSAFEDHKEELEHYEQMFGRERGRLAVSLDRLTNALVLVGQHGVYCTSQRNPTVPAMDIRIIANELTSAKELVQAVMEELRRTNDTQS
jgi:hypothetical protein